MKRRNFIAGVGAGAVAGSLAQGREASKAATAELPKRVLGRTGAKISVVGFPGLALRHYEQQECNDGLRRALDRGVNYFDVAPAYGKDGECEIKMGKGMRGVDRDSYFLSCKSKFDDAKGCREELERSLKRLNTDHFDLYQLHCLQKKEEVEQALGPGGALETIIKAKQEGKVKHIGFSAHTTVAALTALDGFEFETCMFPFNYVEWFKHGFGKAVVEKAKEKGTALISIKPVSKGRWPKGMEKSHVWWYRPITEPEEMRRAMRWTFSIPGMVTGIPVSFLDVLDLMIDGVLDLQPAKKDDARQLELAAADCTPLFEKKDKELSLVTPHDKCFG